jgi:hypothetical protein
LGGDHGKFCAVKLVQEQVLPIVVNSREDVSIKTGPLNDSRSCAILLGAFLVMAVSPLRGAEQASTSQLAENHRQLSPINATTLVEQRVVKMGTIQSTKVSVALEDLAEQESLAYLGNSAPVGLVVSIFVESEQQDKSSQPKQGALARAISNRVKKASLSAFERVQRRIDGLGTKKPGDVVGFNLDLTSSERAKFPIDRLIIVTFEQGHSGEAAFLHRSMARVLEDARQEGLAALVVPCIGYHWDEKHSLGFEAVFKPLFKALDASERPLEVFISLYNMWPSMVIEDATRALNQAGGIIASTTANRPSH